MTKTPHTENVKLSILVVDDHAYFRESLASLLREMPGVEAVEEAGDGLEAVRMARSILPGVVVMDIRMPKMDGLEATRQIKTFAPSIRVILYSMYEEESFDQAVLLLADRFIPKQRLFDEILREMSRPAPPAN